MSVARAIFSWGSTVSGGIIGWFIGKPHGNLLTLCISVSGAIFGFLLRFEVITEVQYLLP